MATGFEIIPFMGVLRILTEGNLQVFLLFVALLGPFILFPIIWGLSRAWRDYHTERWSFFTTLLFVNCAIMLFIPFSTWREPLGILRFIVGLQIAVILYSAHTRNLRALRYSTLWFVTLFLLIASDFSTNPIS